MHLETTMRVSHCRARVREPRSRVQIIGPSKRRCASDCKVRFSANALPGSVSGLVVSGLVDAPADRFRVSRSSGRFARDHAASSLFFFVVLLGTPAHIASTSFGAASAPRGVYSGASHLASRWARVDSAMDRARVASAAEASRARIEEDLGAGESVSERVGRVFAGYRCGTMTVRFERHARARASTKRARRSVPPTARTRGGPRRATRASRALTRFESVGTGVVPPLLSVSGIVRRAHPPDRSVAETRARDPSAERHARLD